MRDDPIEIQAILFAGTAPAICLTVAVYSSSQFSKLIIGSKWKPTR